MANANEYKNTGWYAVAHFGVDEKVSIPCFLRRIPYKNEQGEMETTYHHFTYNLEEAELFLNWLDATEAKREIEGRLWKEKNLLKGQVKVIEIAVKIVGTPRED